MAAVLYHHGANLAAHSLDSLFERALSRKGLQFLCIRHEHVHQAQDIVPRCLPLLGGIPLRDERNCGSALLDVPEDGDDIPAKLLLKEKRRDVDMPGAAEIKLKMAKADRAKMETDELKGNMHRSDDVRMITEDMLYAIRNGLVALPGRLAVDVAACGNAAEAYEVMKKDLQAINSDVTVSQVEYDEITAIKPMFLLCGYREEPVFAE